jgi:monomeric sarcosine oxidase
VSALTYDAIVLGLGGIGSAATYWLARSGATVLGIEQFALGHERGESHDHSRIIRLSYHEPHYVALAKLAYNAWADVERDCGEQLVFKTGGLDLGPRDGAIHLASYAAAMRAEGVAYEELDAAEIRRRWPPFAIGDDVHGLYQADAGICAAARATAAHQRAARKYGASLLPETPVTGARAEGNDIVVEAGGASYITRRLVIAAGPWSARALAWFGVHVPLEVTKEQVMYFVPPVLGPFAPDRFPVWIWMDDPSFYGFPVFGERAVKVTQDAGGRPVDPDTRGFAPDPDISTRVRSFVHDHLPSGEGPELMIKTCLYTLTPDRDFVIDALPEHRNVSVAIGAGHAYKFASQIGRLLAAMKPESAAPPHPAFAIDRPVLRMADPPKTYMV